MHIRNDYKRIIFANNVDLGEDIKIDPRTRIVCDTIKIDDGTVILGSSKIECRECRIGKNNFLNDVMIEGSLNAGNTRIQIGDDNLFLQNTRLNCNQKITIGNDVNIGQNVKIWTHASSMDVFNGYPFTLKSVEIGSHIWITADTTILPGVKIGSNVIIGNMSLVNKNIPDGCFAAGIPIKIIKENIYPKVLSFKDKKAILEDCIEQYYELLKFKHFLPNVHLKENLKIEFCIDDCITIFDCENRKISGDINEYSEDFRDFLRYRGIKLFTGKPFQSIKPAWFICAIERNTNPDHGEK